jgi:hypothetical protein
MVTRKDLIVTLKVRRPFMQFRQRKLMYSFHFDCSASKYVFL